MAKLRKNWRDYDITDKEPETYKQAYILFEDYNDGKYYDLCHGIFSDLDVAKEYADAIKEDEKLYIADHKEWLKGEYHILYEI